MVINLRTLISPIPFKIPYLPLFPQFSFKRFLPSRHRKRRLLAIGLILLILLGPLAYFTLRHPEAAEAAWFDDNWAYRKAVPVSKTVASQNDVYINFTGADDIDTSDTTRFQSDCGDLRFTKQNGQLLSYYIVSGCGTSSTVVHVEFDTIPLADITVYYYYGNPTVANGGEASDFSTVATNYSIGTQGAEEKGPGPVAYWKFDEGADNTCSGGTNDVCDETSNSNDGAFGGGGGGGPTNIDDASDFGATPGVGRQVLRTSSGVLYSFVEDTNNCEMWKSTDGTSWALQANVACTSYPTSAIDSSDTIHLTYDQVTGGDAYIRYVTYNTSTDSFGTVETVESGNFASFAYSEPVIAIDSSNEPHVVYKESPVPGTPDVTYSNRISGVTGGVWNKTPVALETVSFSPTDITINEDNIPEISYINSTDDDLTAAVGNTNDATSFTLQDVDTLVNDVDNQRGTSIAIDSSGNTWIGYIDDGTNDFVTLVEHLDADAWTTWQTPVTNSNVGKEPSIAIDGTDVYVFYEDDLDDIVYDKYTGSWAGETTLQTGTFQDVKTRWSLYNNPSYSTYGIDYLYSDNTDVFWANLSISTGGTLWQTEDLCLSGKCLFYDGSDDIVTVTNADSIDLDQHLAGGFTFQAWVRVSSDGEGNVGEIFDKGTNTYMRITNEGTDGLADLEASVDLATTDETMTFVNAITLNRWHHIAIGYTDDGDDEATVYIDGLAATATTDANASGAPAADTNNLLIGGSSTANFHGFIDEFKIYKAERTPSEVLTDFTGQAALHGATATFSDDKSFLSEGLVGYWKMDESSGNASDSSGNATTLTNTASTTFSGAKFANGAEPNGTTQYFDAVDNASLSVTGNLTLSAWIEPDDTTGSQDIVGKWDGANESYLLAMEGSNLRMYIDSVSNYEATTGTPLSANTMTHVAGVYDSVAQTVTLYVNGAIEASSTTGTIPSSIGDDAGEFDVGAEDSSSTAANFFDGHLDEVRVYNRAFTPAEVADLYEWAPGPVLYYDLNENTGTSTVNDKSGNEYSGTMNGTMTNDDWIPGSFGSALDFDGTDDNISKADEADLDFTTTDSFTLSAFIKHTTQSSGQDVILAKYETVGGDGGYKLLMEADGDLTCGVDTDNSTFPLDSATSTAATYDDDSWHHVSCVKDGSSTLKLYIDGVLIDTDSALTASGSYANDDTFYAAVDGDGTSNDWLGQLDELKIYRYARTPTQIIEDMNAGHPAPGSPVGSTTGHWKFDEGYSPTLNDSSPNTNPASIPDGATGGAVKIDDASDFGGMQGAGRQVVRTSSGTLYSLINDGGNCEVWKSTDEGNSWAIQDSANDPGCNSAPDDVAIAIDSSNVIHLLYISTGSPQFAYYKTFATSSDTFGAGQDAVHDSGASETVDNVDIAIDSNDIPHAVLHDFDGVTGDVFYDNRIGGSWNSTDVTIPGGSAITAFGHTITINEDNIPEISYIDVTNTNLEAAVGDDNDPDTAAQWTSTIVDSNVNSASNIRGTSIAIDSSGNTWIGYIDDGTNDFVTLVEHLDADAWTTWQTPVTNSNVGSEPSLAIGGSYMYIFYQDDSTDTKIVYDRYDGSSWLGETTLETPGGGIDFQDVKAKWSFYNNSHGSAQIDYLFSDATDVFYNRLSLGEPPTWKAKDACKLDKCLEFDGTNDVVTVGNAPEIDFNDNLTLGFTFSAWVNADTAGEGTGGQIFYKGANTWLRVDTLSGSNLDVEASLDLATTDATLNVSAPITTATWHYVAMTWTDDADDEITIWVNGINRGSSTDGSGAPAADVNNLFIGGTTTNNFDGRIDDFKVYSSELTAAQIKGDFTARSAAAFGGVLGAQDNEGFGGNAPVGYWPLDENTGTTTTYDKSGNGNNGTLTSITESSWVPGKVGSALSLDGSADYIDIGTGPTSVKTISFWVYPETTTEYFINVNADPAYISASSGTVSATGFTSPIIYVDGQSTSTIVADKWQHIVVTDTTAENASDFDIGRTQGSNYLEGEIDQVRIYDYVLSQAQIAYDFNRGAPVGYWKLDECEGTTANDSGSGGNNGTIIPGASIHTSAGTCNSGSASEMWDDGQTGKRNYSLDFDGGDDYVDMNDVAELDFNDQDFSITGWFNRETYTTDDVIVAKRNGVTDSDQGYIVYVDDANDTLIFEVCDATVTCDEYQLESSSTFLATGWNHFAIVWDDDSAANTEIYINGIADNATDTGTIANVVDLSNALDFRLGSESDGGEPFAGELDDVRVYNYALTADQIKRDYNNGAQFFGPSEGSP